MMDEVNIYSINKVKQMQINLYINTKEQTRSFIKGRNTVITANCQHNSGTAKPHPYGFYQPQHSISPVEMR